MPMPQKLRSRIGLGMDYSPLNSKIRHLRSTVSTILSSTRRQAVLACYVRCDREKDVIDDSVKESFAPAALLPTRLCANRAFSQF